MLLLPNSLDINPPDFGFSSPGVTAGVVAGVDAGVLDGLTIADAGFAGVKFKPGIGLAGGAVTFDHTLQQYTKTLPLYFS